MIRFVVILSVISWTNFKNHCVTTYNNHYFLLITFGNNKIIKQITQLQLLLLLSPYLYISLYIYI